ncbi:hypothetical protein MPSEU_000393400 [Mayamaea pseudoterrestris]|nr:hypothetical protein MPSEU_000393400 [Mayamaea pseudoterrestris]
MIAKLAGVALLLWTADAFLPPQSPSGRRLHSHRSSGGNGNNHGNKPPPPTNLFHRKADFGSYEHSFPSNLKLLPSRRNDTDDTATDERSSRRFRGGASSSSSLHNADNVVKGTQATLASTASYWSRAVHSIQSAITKPFRMISSPAKSIFQSKQQKQQVALMKQLQTLPIQRVTISNNETVLPREVVRIAAKRSGLLGQPLQTDRVQQFAHALKAWYHRNGFVLHGVTGATLNTDTATAEIAVNEPQCAHPSPVHIQFCKEMVVDNKSGAVMTLRQYKNHHEQRKSFGFGNDSISKDQLNMTLVPSSGRTNPLRIASALGLVPKQPFQWDAGRWNRVLASGIFTKVLHATPTQLPDGTIQLQILATEAPARHLEYGVGRSMYSGSWEGALDFEHVNVLGGGERLGLSVKRGTKDAEPSARLSFSDARFGRAGGYDCDLFSEYIGDGQENNGTIMRTTDYDPTLNRKGATFRLHDKVFRKSTSSLSMEQTVTKAGRYENIGSTTISVGPFVKDLPMNARMNVETAITTGTRLVNPLEGDNEYSRSLLSGKSFLPYFSATATTRQTFPLTNSRLVNGIGSEARPLLLALRHSVIASTRHLPRHVAKAQGIASSIRGSTTNDEVSSAVQGTMELRIPVPIPLPIQQDASIVFFGDWLYACKENSSPFTMKSSVGFGVRKNVKGFPLKLDLCYSPENINNRLRLKPSIGLGGDFVI